MTTPATSFVCAGCGRPVEGGELPFACAGARPGDDIDHVLVRREREPGALAFPPEVAAWDPNPFIRYRRLLHPYHVAIAGGLSDATWCRLVADLDDEVAQVERRAFGFRVTPFEERTDLECWVKDETDNVAGSHKARHLMGILLYLRVLDVLGRRPELSSRPLAIASCGNAALAAAVVARAGRRRLRVFVPDDAQPVVMEQLSVLGATVEVCVRHPDERGDPTVTRFREEVAAGALPLSCQGPDCGLTIDGGRTLGYEIADTLRAHRGWLDHLVVQVGGGALASALWQSLDEARRLGVLPRLPQIHLVQTRGAFPLDEAYARLSSQMMTLESGDGEAPVESWVREAAGHRGRYMRPWPTVPRSIAHGILDDETYDWVQLVAALRTSGGSSVVVDEETLLLANRMANDHRGEAREVDETGSAGLAGLIELRRSGRIAAGERAAVIFSGARRGGEDKAEPQVLLQAV